LSCKDRAFEGVAALRLTSPHAWAFSRIFGHGGKNSALARAVHVRSTRSFSGA
jgi:hypothetical protein